MTFIEPRIGQLNHPIQFHEIQRVNDPSFGQQQEFPAKIGDDWAKCEYLSGSEPTVANQKQANIRVQFIIRHRTDIAINGDRRIVDLNEGPPGMTYDIVSAGDPTGKRKWLVIEAIGQTVGAK